MNNRHDPEWHSVKELTAAYDEIAVTLPAPNRWDRARWVELVAHAQPDVAEKEYYNSSQK